MQLVQPVQSTAQSKQSAIAIQDQVLTSSTTILRINTVLYPIRWQLRGFNEFDHHDNSMCRCRKANYVRSVEGGDVSIEFWVEEGRYLRSLRI
jgi:hypothetical protein